MTLETGCYFDSHHGRYNISNVVAFAMEHGFGGKAGDRILFSDLDLPSTSDGPLLCHCERPLWLSSISNIHLGTQYLFSCTEHGEYGSVANDPEACVHIVDEAEYWLNDNTDIPKGAVRGWNEGDFGLYHWCEECDEVSLSPTGCDC